MRWACVGSLCWRQDDSHQGTQAAPVVVSCWHHQHQSSWFQFCPDTFIPSGVPFLDHWRELLNQGLKRRTVRRLVKDKQDALPYSRKHIQESHPSLWLETYYLSQHNSSGKISLTTPKYWLLFLLHLPYVSNTFHSSNAYCVNRWTLTVLHSKTLHYLISIQVQRGSLWLEGRKEKK